MNRIDLTFAQLREQARSAFMPYVPLGYPTPQISRELIRAIGEAGADVIELGMPFSDPLADGPVIQEATQVALKNGMTVSKCLSMVRIAREDGVTIPLVLMGYYNPILRFGTERFARGAQEAGADGIIVPDLPPEEAGDLKRASEANSLAMVFLAAPTSTRERLGKIAGATRSFLYLVSLTGVTGAREKLPMELGDFVRRTRKITDKPLCIGFGISNPATARNAAEIADGVIVGSALVSRIGEPATAVKNARDFVTDFRQAIDSKSRVRA